MPPTTKSLQVTSSNPRIPAQLGPPADLKPPSHSSFPSNPFLHFHSFFSSFDQEAEERTAAARERKVKQHQARSHPKPKRRDSLETLPSTSHTSLFAYLTVDCETAKNTLNLVLKFDRYNFNLEQILQ